MFPLVYFFFYSLVILSSHNQDRRKSWLFRMSHAHTLHTVCLNWTGYRWRHYRLRKINRFVITDKPSCQHEKSDNSSVHLPCENIKVKINITMRCYNCRLTFSWRVIVTALKTDDWFLLKQWQNESLRFQKDYIWLGCFPRVTFFPVSSLGSPSILY